jgi:hypothetical protein
MLIFSHHVNPLAAAAAPGKRYSLPALHYSTALGVLVELREIVGGR